MQNKLISKMREDLGEKTREFLEENNNLVDYRDVNLLDKICCGLRDYNNGLRPLWRLDSDWHLRKFVEWYIKEVPIDKNNIEDKIKIKKEIKTGAKVYRLSFVPEKTKPDVYFKFEIIIQGSKYFLSFHRKLVTIEGNNATILVTDATKILLNHESGIELLNLKISIQEFMELVPLSSCTELLDKSSIDHDTGLKLYGVASLFFDKRGDTFLNDFFTWWNEGE